MDQAPAPAPAPDNTGNEDYRFWRKIYFAVVLVVGLVAKLCGWIVWSHLIFAIISVPLTFPLVCWLLYALIKVIAWCCQPGPRKFILYYLSICALLELYRVETHSEALSGLATGAKTLLSFIVHIPLAIIGVVSQEDAEAVFNPPPPEEYTYNIWNIFNFAWGIPFFVCYFCLQAFISLFYYKGKSTLVGKVAVGAAVGTVVHHVTKKVLNGRSEEA